MSAAPAITADRFEEEVIKSEIPVLVDFWAEWCGPCKAMGPVIDDLAADYEGKAKIFKMNVQSEAAFAGKYGVQSIPTLLVFKNGEVVARMVGKKDKSEVTVQLDQYI